MPSSVFDSQVDSLKARIIDHANTPKSDFAVYDMKNLTSNQSSIIKSFVNSLPKNKKDFIILLD